VSPEFLDVDDVNALSGGHRRHLEGSMAEREPGNPGSR
jgi:hypothetical protein